MQLGDDALVAQVMPAAEPRAEIGPRWFAPACEDPEVKRLPERVDNDGLLLRRWTPGDAWMRRGT